MSAELIQFNSGDHVLGGKNITEAISSDGDVVFNESYIVVGALLEGAHIHATYDLRVLGNIKAENITVNGSLFVDGDIDADSLVCRGTFFCAGKARIKKIEFGSYSASGSLVSEELRVSGDLFVRTTVDTNTLLEADGLVIAGEGIMGDGEFKAKAAIANEYFEFSGKNSSNVFEISTMDFSDKTEQSEPVAVKGTIDLDSMEIGTAIESFNKVLTRSINEWTALEEDELVKAFRSTAADLPDLHSVDDIIDFIVELSYKREIKNFRDYLYILFAKHVFPEELAKYETLEPVLSEMFNAASLKLTELEFKAKNIEDFARSIYILSKFYCKSPISLADGADKIFSSIGLRYSTVEHAWRTYNG